MLLAVRAIDLAIFGTLGALWLGGVAFIVLLYRWILRYERSSGAVGGTGAQEIDEPGTEVTASVGGSIKKTNPGRPTQVHAPSLASTHP